MFNLSLKAKQEERKKAANESENSMANAETEDEEHSFIKSQNRLIGKKPSKKIIFNGQG